VRDGDSVSYVSGYTTQSTKEKLYSLQVELEQEKAARIQAEQEIARIRSMQ